MSTPRTPTSHLRRRLTWASETLDLVVGQIDRIGRNMADLLTTVRAVAPEGSNSTHTPSEVDPTGEAVAAQVRADIWRAEELAASIADQVSELLRLWQRYDRAPGDRDEATTRKLEDLNRHKCQVHLRAGYLADARGAQPNAVRHRGQQILDAPLWLCEWCEKQIRAAGAEGARGTRAIPGTGHVRAHARKMGLPESDHAVAPAGTPKDVAEWVSKQQRAV